MLFSTCKSTLSEMHIADLGTQWTDITLIMHVSTRSSHTTELVALPFLQETEKPVLTSFIYIQYKTAYLQFHQVLFACFAFG